MRLWSLHPGYLDAAGLVALWRESLLARKVLQGLTRGYKYHPQLIRFRESPAPLAAINSYLRSVFSEARRRGYHFDPKKLQPVKGRLKIQVTNGQVEFERGHLLKKLKIRQAAGRCTMSEKAKLIIHPLFRMVRGPKAGWEKT
jgi:hypothetical protein